MKLPIYLDSQATTRVDPRVLEAMLPFFSEKCGNAASSDHLFGSEAADAVEKSRKLIAGNMNTSPEHIIFTSGATESNNIAILGTLLKNRDKNHIITSVTEHKSVLDTCKHLESLGKSVTYVPVDQYGVVNLEAIEQAVSERTALISVMVANNEIGTIAPIEEIAEIARKHEVPFHTDAAQAAGHIPLDLQNMSADLVSISAHKMYGPKGVGALYIGQNNIKPLPLMFGGGHERGIRSGTLNVAGIVGFGKAFEISAKEMRSENSRYLKWTGQMLGTLQNKAAPVEQNGHPTKRLAHNLNLSFHDIESKALIRSLRNRLAISSGSACSTLDVEPSYVVIALGFGPERAHSAIRIGLGRFNTDEEIVFATEAIVQDVSRLRRISS